MFKLDEDEEEDQVNLRRISSTMTTLAAWYREKVKVNVSTHTIALSTKPENEHSAAIIPLCIVKTTHSANIMWS